MRGSRGRRLPDKVCIRGPGEWWRPFKPWVRGHILEAPHTSFVFDMLDLKWRWDTQAEVVCRQLECGVRDFLEGKEISFWEMPASSWLVEGCGWGKMKHGEQKAYVWYPRGKGRPMREQGSTCLHGQHIRLPDFTRNTASPVIFELQINKESFFFFFQNISNITWDILIWKIHCLPEIQI